MKNLIHLFFLFSFYMVNGQSCPIITLENITQEETDILFDVYLSNAINADSDLYLGNSDIVISYNQAEFDAPALQMIPGSCTFSPKDQSDLATTILRTRYESSTSLSVTDNAFIINVSGPNVTNTVARNSSVAVINSQQGMHRLGRFKISGFTGFKTSVANLEIRENGFPIYTQIHHVMDVNESFSEKLVTTCDPRQLQTQTEDSPIDPEEVNTLTNWNSKQDNQQIEILIYPNPVTNALQIKTTKQNGDLVIMDSYGRIIYSALRTDHITVNVQKWTAGVYFVKLGDVVKKIVKL